MDVGGSVVLATETCRHLSAAIALGHAKTKRQLAENGPCPGLESARSRRREGGVVTSVVVTMKVKGDTDQFRRFLDTDADRLREIAKTGQAAGAIHHRFAVGDGFVLVIDEWESAEAFQRFLGSDEIAAVMRDAGAQSEPEIEFAEAVESPDQF